MPDRQPVPVEEIPFDEAAPIIDEVPAPPVHRSGFPLRLPRISASETFAAFRYPNYRLWFYGQLASLVGTWMQTTAQGYLVFQLTHSEVYLGYVAFAAGLPTWLFTLFGGVVSDRMSRRKLMVFTQSGMLVLAFILAGLTFSGLVQPWHIIVLAFLLGIANAFDAPARQAFVLEMVSREHLGHAIALNAAMFNMATAVGPAIAGLAYALLGPGWCFTINGISFIAVIVALVLMKLAPFTPRPTKVSAFSDLKEGMRYVLAHAEIRVLILIIGSASLLGLSFNTLVPAWAVEILHGNATTNGLLLSARGVGSLIGALMVAALASYRFKGKIVTIGIFVYPAMLLAFALTSVLPLSLLTLMGVGWAFMAMSNTCNSLVQHLVRDELRGRVMGVYSLVFFGFMPIGGLAAGALAQEAGSPTAVTAAAVLAIAFAGAIWLLAPRIRRLEI